MVFMSMDIIKYSLVELPEHNKTKNPENCGIWIALIGFAIFTGPIYHLVIAVECIIVMIPYIMLENKPLNM
jgi:hypothetical protein